MRTVGIKVLKNKLSEYVRAAEAGETVLVTDRDRVVAELSPPRRGVPEASVEAILEQGRREGWLTPAKRSRRSSSRRYGAGAYSLTIQEFLSSN
jgi:antitoxin (DNA-binding transcriptional repressor) of toxin-antitoxin stability system